MAKSELPAKTSQAQRLQGHFAPLAASGQHADGGESAAMPEEGAALIRAFLQIRRRDVRAAIIDLVSSLSSVNSRF